MLLGRLTGLSRKGRMCQRQEVVSKAGLRQVRNFILTLCVLTE